MQSTGDAKGKANPKYMVLRDLDATHVRRVRLIVVACSTALILIGLGFTLYFVYESEWGIAAFEIMLLTLGIAGAVMLRRGQMRGAVLLILFSIFIILCTMALIMDVPTSHVPRAVHLYFIPLAFASYLLLKLESPWLRHGYSLACMAAVAVFSSSTFGIAVGLNVPDDPHVMITRTDSVCAMALLYVLLHIVMGDVNRMENYLHAANNRFVGLVSGMFPKVIAERLLTNRENFAERYANCSILFADIVGFTGISERMEPEALIGLLSEIFMRFDRCVEQHHITKIKTIGDAYMVASGVPEANPDHAQDMILFAQKLLAAAKDFHDIELRIGIASGELVAGVIGQSRQVYDVWGDVVNLASRMESHGSPGQIQVCESTYELTRQFFEFEKRTEIAIKGKSGKHNAYLLL